MLTKWTAIFAAPLLRRLDAHFSPRSLGFNPGLLHVRFDIPDQAAQYHILGLYVGGFISDRHLAGYRVKE
jgi:hypothetical protein